MIRDMAEPTMSIADVDAMLTGKGGIFETVSVVVNGVEVTTAKNRAPHLRALLQNACFTNAFSILLEHLPRPAPECLFYQCFFNTSTNVRCQSRGIRAGQPRNPKWRNSLVAETLF